MVIVVRNVGERSLPLCLEALRRQSGKVIVIEERPFIRAVQKTFEIGAKCQDEQFLLGLDADVVLYDDAIGRMEGAAVALMAVQPNLMKIDFPLDDKFRGRIYGSHLYVNRYSQFLEKFFSVVPYDEAQKRPESMNLSIAKKELGLSAAYDRGKTVGSHDFEQYYGHIYAKYLNRGGRDWQAVKKIRIGIEGRQQKFPGDLDYAVALAGLDASIAGMVITNADKYPPAETIIESLGTEEKKPLA
jgi:hypothetical protein